MSRVAVVGAGSWGTTLADLLARKGEEVVLWAYEPEVADEVNRRHRNDLFLPDSPLCDWLTATTDLATAVAGADVVVTAAPSHVLRTVMLGAAAAIAPSALVVSATKGLETASHKRMSEVLADVLPAGVGIAALSGPTFAQEVYERQPTAATVAAVDADVARRAQLALNAERFRLYTNTDLVGVELAGALKNVIAIAAGMLDGLGVGHNARAALVTRGLVEMSRLGVAMGAQPLTFSGLSGMGDLILTATGHLSRNRALGVALGQGEQLEEYLSRRRSVAEGVRTARAAVELASQVGVELPIATEVARILFEGKSPRQAIRELMERALRSEAGGGS